LADTYLRNELHEDHVFPKSVFERKQLAAAGLPPEQVERYIEQVNPGLDAPEAMNGSSIEVFGP
jgi:hypothetical protein